MSTGKPGRTKTSPGQDHSRTTYSKNHDAAFETCLIKLGTFCLRGEVSWADSNGLFLLLVYRQLFLIVVKYIQPRLPSYPLLSVQVSGLNCIHTVVQPSLSSIQNSPSQTEILHSVNRPSPGPQPPPILLSLSVNGLF